MNDNGSMTLYPFPSDGRIQVQDPCAAVTNLITEYNQQTLYADWGITMDSTRKNYKMQLNRFDGAKMPPMWLMANPPNMLPTQYLTGVNVSRLSPKLGTHYPPQTLIFFLFSPSLGIWSSSIECEAGRKHVGRSVTWPSKYHDPVSYTTAAAECHGPDATGMRSTIDGWETHWFGA